MNRYTQGLVGDQPQAFDTIISAIEANQKIIKLVGYAGTGKTFLISRIAEWAQDNFYDVVLAAPTHKAAGVIRSKLGNLDLEVKTIHSLLGFGMPIDMEGDSGERKLVKQRKTELKGLVICDEGSMIGEVLLEEIRTQSKVQWLFVGDAAQLAPVGEKVSELLNDPDAVLETVVRQAEGSEILVMATAVRKGDLSLGFRPGGDVSSVVDKGALFEQAFERFSNPAYQDDANYARMLVFRNAKRRALNDRMRSLIVKSDDPFAPGEWLVMYNPFSALTTYDKGTRFLTVDETFERMSRLNELAEEAKTYHKKTGSKSRWRQFFEYKESFGDRHFHTSQEILVEEAERDVADVDADWWTPFKIWNLTVKADDFTYRNFPVLDRSEYPNYKAAMDTQRREALHFAKLKQRDGDEYDEQRREAWRRYFLLKDLFGHVDYGFACTTHKAQGSTFNHVFVDVPDLLSSSMKERLLYVALTRASDSLTFIQSNNGHPAHAA